MSNGFNAKITKDAFTKCSTDEKLDLIYYAVIGMNDGICTLEKKAWIKSLWAFVGGLIGGFLAYLGVHKL